MLSDLQKFNLFPASGEDILRNIIVALICGLIISWIYRKTYKGAGYSASFVNSIILLTMITSIVIMVIGNNLARAFGLVGAMSIIRFRTAVKDTNDIIFIFFALSIGMAAGVGYHNIAFIATIIIGSIFFVISKTNISNPKREEYLLQFSYLANGENIPLYVPVLKRYCGKYRIMNVKSLAALEGMLELSVFVSMKDKDNNNKFVHELQKTEGVSNINLYFDEEEF